MKNKREYNILRFILIFAACGWGISILGIVLPWEKVSNILIKLGSSVKIEDSMQIYWARMICGAFSFIGVLFAYVAIRPQKHLELLKILGVFSIVEGIILLINGISLKLTCFPFYGDVIFCFFVGIGILVLRNKIEE